MKKRAIIFVNGNLSDLRPAKKIITDNDYLICADGGAEHAFKLDLKPNVIIGDMDSIPKQGSAPLLWADPIKIIKYPTKKDETDFELAIRFALKRKFNEIIIFGILGDRIDHFLANIFLIAEIQIKNKKLKIKIIEGNKEIFVLDKKIEISGRIGDEISIIPVSEKLEKVTTEGLEYKLDHEDLFFGTTRGVSNVMIKKTVKIRVSNGVAIIEHNSL